VRIALGNDHRGLAMKEQIMDYLVRSGHECKDFGCFDTNSVDYPDYAQAVGEAVRLNTCDFGILICGTGIGMSIAANKIRGIRAARCVDAIDAYLSRAHNNTNILCLGSQTTDEEKVVDIVNTFLTTTFEGDRHINRLAKVEALERTLLDNK
jgi:ribose 5-phosphate isomerase B